MMMMIVIAVLIGVETGRDSCSRTARDGDSHNSTGRVVMFVPGLERVVIAVVVIEGLVLVLEKIAVRYFSHFSTPHNTKTEANTIPTYKQPLLTVLCLDSLIVRQPHLQIFSLVLRVRGENIFAKINKLTWVALQ